MIFSTLLNDGARKSRPGNRAALRCPRPLKSNAASPKRVPIRRPGTTMPESSCLPVVARIVYRYADRVNGTLHEVVRMMSKGIADEARRFDVPLRRSDLAWALE